MALTSRAPKAEERDNLNLGFKIDRKSAKISRRANLRLIVRLSDNMIQTHRTTQIII